MIVVFYRNDSQEVLGWCKYTPDVVIDSAGVKADDLIMTGVNWSQVSYGLYKDQDIPTKRDDEGNSLPWTIQELALEPISASDLPRSMHIAALKAVDVVNKKATVVRKWMGQNYEVPNCYVSLGALEAYQAGKITVYNPAYAMNSPQNANSFVLVYFVSENPYNTAIEIPVIVDKIVK